MTEPFAVASSLLTMQAVHEFASMVALQKSGHWCDTLDLLMQNRLNVTRNAAMDLLQTAGPKEWHRVHNLLIVDARADFTRLVRDSEAPPDAIAFVERSIDHLLNVI